MAEAVYLKQQHPVKAHIPDLHKQVVPRSPRVSIYYVVQAHLVLAVNRTGPANQQHTHVFTESCKRLYRNQQHYRTAIPDPPTDLGVFRNDTL